MADEQLVLNDHLVGVGFDPDICSGEHPDVDGPCPKFIDGIASRCGDCGCPMMTMDLLQAPPTREDATGDGCPRVDYHETADKESL